ncbi:MAG: hypothetical protein LBI56_04105 [Puniceicoccales bacterium]|nr:hypothetical protein [Puniceicoccales bacterium]
MYNTTQISKTSASFSGKRACGSVIDTPERSEGALTPTPSDSEGVSHIAQVNTPGPSENHYAHRNFRTPYSYRFLSDPNSIANKQIAQFDLDRRSVRNEDRMHQLQLQIQYSRQKFCYLKKEF